MRFWNSLLWTAIKSHIIWEIMKTGTHKPWDDVLDLAVDLLINLWWSLKIDSNRTTWLKFTNSVNFKLLAYPYSWGYSVLWYNEAYCLPLVVTSGQRPTLQYWIQTLFLLTLSVQDTSVLVLNCTYLWHYFHSLLVNEGPRWHSG